MTAVCVHGMPNPAACIECMEEGVIPAAPKPVATGHTFTASYNGRCFVCDHSIEAGVSEIVPVDGGWVHEWCADQPGVER